MLSEVWQSMPKAITARHASAITVGSDMPHDTDASGGMSERPLLDGARLAVVAHNRLLRPAGLGSAGCRTGTALARGRRQLLLPFQRLSSMAWRWVEGWAYRLGGWRAHRARWRAVYGYSDGRGLLLGGMTGLRQIHR